MHSECAVRPKTQAHDIHQGSLLRKKFSDRTRCIANRDGVPVSVLHGVAAFVHRAVVDGRAVSENQIVDVPQPPTS